MRVPGVNERKSAPGRTDIHRLPKAIQNQDLTVQQRVQINTLGKWPLATFPPKCGESITRVLTCQRKRPSAVDLPENPKPDMLANRMRCFSPSLPVKFPIRRQIGVFNYAISASTSR